MKKLINILFCIFCIAYVSSASAAEYGFSIVVHKANTVTEVNKKLLSDIFLKKKTFWPDGKGIVVVDQISSAEVRQEFSEKVLSRPVSSVRNYWQQILFAGRGVPPVELKSDQEVVAFISEHEEAIGYVSDDTEVGNLKVVKIK